MSSHGPTRHLMAFGARTSRKSESVYYNLQFWLFPGDFWNFSGIVIFSPEIFLDVPTWLVTLCGCLVPFVLPQKAHKHSLFHFLWNLKLSRNERKSVHICVSSHITHFQWPPMPLGGIPWSLELGARESPKACIITFNFGCFRDIFGLLWSWPFFSPETFLESSMWLVTLRGCLAPFVLPRKACKHGICSSFVKPKIDLKWT